MSTQFPTPLTPQPGARKGDHTVLIVASIVILFFAMVSLGGVLAVRWVMKNRLPDTAEIPQIMKEAAGAAPIPGDDTPQRKAIRDAFRYLLEDRREYEEETKKRTSSPEFASLMQASSFVPPVRDALMTQLRELRDIDEKHLHAVEQFPAVVDRNLRATGMSDSRVEAFDAGVQKGFSESLGQFRETTQTEMQWLDACLKLYQFAGEHESEVRVDGSQIVIEDEAVRTQFNDLEQKAEALRQKTADLANTLEQKQHENQQKFGITEQDVK